MVATMPVATTVPRTQGLLLHHNGVGTKVPGAWTP